METPPPVPPNSLPPVVQPATPVVPPVAPEHEAWLRAQRGGGSWFFWIAGLSLINAIVIQTGGDFNFVLGLGVTAIADTVFHSMGSSVGHILAYLFDAVVLGLFVLFGVFARRGGIWAFITGMVLYALDAGIYAVLPETPQWVPIGFHAFALFSMWGGLTAARKLKRAAAAPVI